MASADHHGRIAASALGDSFAGEYDRIADIEWAETELDGGWLVLVCGWGSLHVVPILDSVLHTVEEGDDCVCVPNVESVNGGFIVSHASLDGRELRETT